MNNFLGLVKKSRALSKEQKELLLADPPLPEAYQKKMDSLLESFDKNSKAREAYLRDKLEILYTQFITSLNEAGIAPEKKKELAEKARKQIEGFFPKHNDKS